MGQNQNQAQTKQNQQRIDDLKKSSLDKFFEMLDSAYQAITRSRMNGALKWFLTVLFAAALIQILSLRVKKAAEEAARSASASAQGPAAAPAAANPAAPTVQLPAPAAPMVFRKPLGLPPIAPLAPCPANPVKPRITKQDIKNWGRNVRIVD